jgi:cation diffusion facilitator CzcD-associated flavoprotein CzcO
MCHKNFSLRLGSRIARIWREGAGVAIEHQTSVDAADFLIVGTGFTVDLACEPLFADVISHIALWADRYTPPEELVRPQLSRYPWLGDGFEFVERSAGSCPALGRIHLFNHGAVASLGAISSDVPGLNTGAERLASRIAQHLFREDIAEVRQSLEAWSEHELIGTPVYAP